jgi:hypothetical protein
MRTRMVGALSATVLAVVGAGSGCGSGGGYDNASRPPAPATISIVVASDRVAVSPARIGAGPAVLLIANESDRSRDVTLSAPAGASRSCVQADASSGPINPQSTARIQLPLAEGTCAVGVAGGGVKPARLTVGRERSSAQQDLLQP